MELPRTGHTLVNSATEQARQCDVVAATVGFVLAEGDRTSLIYKVLPLTVMPLAGPMLFGMDLVSGGVLVVDGVAGHWTLKLVSVLGAGTPATLVPKPGI